MSYGGKARAVIVAVVYSVNSGEARRRDGSSATGVVFWEPVVVVGAVVALVR